MKHTLFSRSFFLIFSFFFSSFILTQELFKENYSIFSKKPQSGRKENAQVVIANLAQMIGQIGHIVEEPHNADNVGNAVTNIVNNIVKITVHAIQNKKIGFKKIENTVSILK